MRLGAILVLTGAFLLSASASALAAPASHPRKAALDISGFNHACGVASDSNGDVYVASAGEEKVKVFDASHAQIATIADANEPCGLAIDSQGDLFVSERGTGNVIRFAPDAYPLTPTPIYTPTPIDTTGEARGIAVDIVDDSLFVARGADIAQYHGTSLEAELGAGELGDASGVAAFTAPSGHRYLFAADEETNEVKVFSGETLATLKLRNTVSGVDHDHDPATPEQQIGFGVAGSYLAADPGNELLAGKCTATGQACTAGHLLFYDADNEVVDELDATGHFVDQIDDPALEDAEPTGLAVERSDQPSDGTIYVTAGPGAGSKALAFGPLAQPSREQVTALSQTLPTAGAVAVDRYGDVYVAAGSLIKVFDPTGKEVKVGPAGNGIEDSNTPLEDLAVDSEGNLYVLERKKAVTYYAPSAFPLVDGTSYARHEPPVASSAEFPVSSDSLLAIAVHPGPGKGKDRLFVTGGSETHIYAPASEGSGRLDEKFAEGLSLGVRRWLAIDGRNGTVYFGANASPIQAVDAEGTEVVARIGGGCAEALAANPVLAVDQGSGHVIAFENGMGLREYEAGGGCVGEFEPEPPFTKTLTKAQRVAVDNSCAVHEPPLSETTTPTCAAFDPAYGTVYVAFDDTAPGSTDLTAFGPLSYGEAPAVALGEASEVGGGEATLRGTVNPRGFALEDCRFEYLTDAEYKANLQAEEPAFQGAVPALCVPGPGAIGKGKSPVTVSATLSGLDPGGRYRFRLVAKNEFDTDTEEAGLLGPPLIIAKAASPILYREATLRAELDPSGLMSEYRFEYVSEAYFQAEGFANPRSTDTKTLAGGAASGPVSANPTDLAEATAYRFRLIAENDVATVIGAEGQFTTLQRPPTLECDNAEFRTGLSAKLPDCRAYELATPADTNGLSPVAMGSGDSGDTFNNWLTPPRGQEAGERLSYFTAGTLPGFDGTGILDAYTATRASGAHPAEGWQSALFSPTYEESSPGSQKGATQHGVGADQRYSFWQIDPEVPYPGSLAAGRYLRTPGGAATDCPSSPPSAFEVLGCGELGTDLGAKSHYLSADGEHAIFSSEVPLKDEPGNESPPAGTQAIYDRAAGSNEAKVLSLIPGGDTPFAQDATYLAASEEGTAVAFEVGGSLYIRYGGQTLAIGESPSAFGGLSAGGRFLFYALAGEGRVFDAEADESTPIAAGVTFVGLADQGGVAFFSSPEALIGGEENEIGQSATEGQPNLYAYDAAAHTTSFIAILDASDFTSFGANTSMHLGRWSSAISPGTQFGRGQAPTRSTPDGGTFVFQSHARLTAYDNEGHGEIYRYRPGAEEALSCVSCDPSGAPPSADMMLEIIQPPISPLETSSVVENLTDDGQRVFFQSADRLSPEDANDAQDVYEWRAPGPGSCQRPGGCLALISSGQGDRGSYLYAIGADGRDVFFRTTERLLGADVPGSPSLYDAREGGGIPESIAFEDCQGDACQGNGTPAPALPAPATGGTGGGNAAPAKPARRGCPKGKGKAKTKGRARCVKKKNHMRHERNKGKKHHHRSKRGTVHP